jgi:four helix bundle protein
MASIERFEDIAAWQKARELTRQVYGVTRSGEFGRDYGLRDQIRRAAVSILSNIAERFGRGGDKEFLQFLSTAKGSVSEVQAQLYGALDARYLNQATFAGLYALAEETGRLIGGLMKYLRQSNLKGSKYK